MPDEAVVALAELARILDGLGLRYVVGGSVASGAWGEPRATQDVDLIVLLPIERVPELHSALKDSFYVDESLMLRAAREGRSFNLLHLQRYVKFDLFVAGQSVLDAANFEDPVLRQLDRELDRVFPITTAEVIVLRKLDWYQRGDRVSDRQWRDVLAVLRVQRERLDVGRMRELAAASGLEALLDEAFEAAWGGPTPS